MSDRIDADWLRRPQTQAVFAALAMRGVDVRAVGGAVRNALIGKAAADVDLATPALPDATMQAARAAGFTVVPTGLQHGTVTVIAGGVAHEITTLRRDVETDGRHAVVDFTADWAVDAARRDFTINALYCAADGTLYDPLGSGRDDLARRRVRFIGDADMRIREDYLRILRFFRFTAEYALDAAPDAVGLVACSRGRDGLARLSAERISAEVLKLLVAPHADAVVQVMFEHGYWPALLGTVPWPTHLARRGAADSASGRSGDAVERLAILGAGTRFDARAISRRMRLSNADADLMERAVGFAAELAASTSAHVLKLGLYRHGRPVVLQAVAIAESRQGGDWSRVTTTLAALPVPVLPVRGQDLLDRGIMPGREIGERLRVIEQVWIDSDFTALPDALLAGIL